MKLTHQFNQIHLDQLIANRLSFYKTQESSGKVLGALVYVSVDTPVQMLNEFAAKVASGYTLHEGLPVSAHVVNGIPFYSFYMLKSLAVQVAEIEVIKAEVETEYRATLRARYDAHLEQIVQETLARERREAEKKAAAALEKATEKARKDATAALGAFV